MRNSSKTIGNLIDNQSICYITSLDEEGFPVTKAMYSPKVREDIKVLYFSTNTSSKRVQQYRKENKASVYFCDRRFYRGVLLKGTMEVLEDAYHKELLWEEKDIMYYPNGVTDPDYCILKFTAISGRFYHNLKSEDFTI